jgi:hypothetical protein
LLYGNFAREDLLLQVAAQVEARQARVVRAPSADQRRHALEDRSGRDR